MKKVEMSIYRYSELDEEIQDKLFSKWLENGGDGETDSWTNENLDSIKKGVKLFAIVKDWCLDAVSHRSYVTFEIWGNEVAELEGLKLRKWLLSNQYLIFKELKEYEKNGKKRRSKITYVNTCYPLTGYFMDDVFLEPFRNFIYNYTNKERLTTLEDLINEGLERCFSAIQTECEYYTSREYFDEIMLEGYNSDILYFYDGTEYGKTMKLA